jgi:hypothetical protein
MPSLEEDIDAAVKAFGTQNVGLVWGLGTYNWKSAEERDAFISQAKLSGVDPSG